MAIVKRENLTFLEKTYLPQIIKGMIVTFREMFKPRFTRQYPEVRWNPPDSFRGRPVLAMNDDGRERCVACGLCARVCPALAIEIQAAETENEKERYPERFEINMVRCIFCGLCEEACPEEAIIMSDEYEIVFNSQDEAIFGKDKLLVSKSKLAKRLEFLSKYR